jgi:hypothetical protein
MKLKLVSYQEEELFDGFLKSKHDPTRSDLQEMKLPVIQAYKEYKHHAATDTFETIQPIGYVSSKKESLIHCYTVSTINRNTLLANIRDAQSDYHKNYCPFCGIYHPDTFDHYLPKDKFPEYSVLPENLQLCCSHCNRIKNEYWIENERRIFLNKYFDDDNCVEYLLCNTSLSNGILKYEYYLDDQSLDLLSIGAIIKSHYKKLDLLSEYRNKANSYVSEHLLAIKSYFSGDKCSLKLSLENDCNTHRDKEGINTWKYAILKSLYKSEYVIDWIFDYIQH